MKKLKYTLLATILAFTINAQAEQLPGSDSRIKTLVFNEHEVFRIVARNGFQTGVEFNLDEKIETITIGDPVGWQISPSGGRVFIKPLHNGGSTNLSIITSKRNYQFELVAANSAKLEADHAYLVRFYYPNAQVEPITTIDRTRGSLRPVSDTQVPEFPVFEPNLPPASPNAAAPIAPPSDPMTQTNMPAASFYNFDYSITGPENQAPVKIFDDGKSTYFEFAFVPTAAKVSLVNPDGTEQPAFARTEGNKLVVDKIAGRFTIRSGGPEAICIFNEKILSLPGAR